MIVRLDKMAIRKVMAEKRMTTAALARLCGMGTPERKHDLDARNLFPYQRRPDRGCVGRGV